MMMWFRCVWMVGDSRRTLLGNVFSAALGGLAGSGLCKWKLLPSLAVFMEEGLDRDEKMCKMGRDLCY